MKTAKFKAVRLIGTAAAAASFFFAAPVHAAENNSNVKPVTVASAANPGYFVGLESHENLKTVNELNAMNTLKTGLVTTDAGTFYYDTFGQKVSGQVEDGGKEYLFDENGQMQTGFQTIEGRTYYYDEQDGAKRSGDVQVSDKTYHLQEDGQLLTGWQEKEGRKAFYNEDGSRKTGQIADIDGKKYSFDENGVMEVNVSRGNYDFGADGVGMVSSSLYQKIADAAIAQLGRTQDCTMLVTNALAAVGINFHGWPLEYLSLGPTTNNPVPGDICVYQGHVALYIGNGKAVHGGWLGNQTVISTVVCDRVFVAYVHPNLPL